MSYGTRLSQSSHNQNSMVHVFLTTMLSEMSYTHALLIDKIYITRKYCSNIFELVILYLSYYLHKDCSFDLWVFYTLLCDKFIYLMLLQEIFHFILLQEFSTLFLDEFLIVLTGSSDFINSFCKNLVSIIFYIVK